MANDDFDYEDDEGVDLGGILTLLAASIGRLGQAVMSLNERLPSSGDERKAADEVANHVREARESLRQALNLISEAEGDGE